MAKDGKAPPAECEDELWADNLAAALEWLVYEITHLSPREDDGSHKCRISGDALERARRALEWRSLHKKKMMLVDADWMKRKVAADPDLECDVGTIPQPDICPCCKRDFPNGATCHMGGCPMGGDV